jgi:hypothetical protein
MSDRLSSIETWVVRAGIFLVFLVTFSDYIIGKIWPIIRPLFQQ